MATTLETIFQVYVNAVGPRQPSGEPRDVGISASQLEHSSSSSSSGINNGSNSRQPTMLQPFSNRSFFRRAWDKVESIFQRVDANLPVYYNNYEREEDEDDDTPDEFIHPDIYHQPIPRSMVFRAPIHKRRLSQHSEELISAGPSDYSPRSSSEWPTRQTYEDWQRNQTELDVEEANIKDLIAGWAMGEGRPWFD